MDVEAAIRSRRTHKAFGPDPVARETIEELLELARWAPNHRLTQPWRFRVLGPETFARVVAAGKPGEAEKLARAPTLIVASARLTGDEHQNREDVLATACAVYIVLLAAHDRGLASYWRTPRRVRDPGRPGGRPARGRRGVRRPDPPRRSEDDPAGEGARSGRALRQLPPVRRRVRARGLEPPRAEAHRDLNPARLPVPPRPRAATAYRRRATRPRSGRRLSGRLALGGEPELAQVEREVVRQALLVEPLDPGRRAVSPPTRQAHASSSRPASVA